ncbi:MAG: S-layer homology domain-containing protein [Acutalibacter sp.]
MYTKDKATVESTSSATVADAGKTSSLITVTADKQNFQIKSQSTNNVVVYTVYVKEIDGLLSLNLGDYEGVITDSNSDGTPDLVTVTMPVAAARDELGYVEDHVRLPLTFTVYGNSPTIDINGADCKSSDVIDLDKLLDSANDGTVNSSNALVNAGWTVKVSCAGYDDVQTYTLKVQFEKSSDTTISYVQLDGEIATIEGNKISAVLPAKKADNTSTTLSAVQVLLYTDPSVKAVSGFVKADSSYQTVAGKTVWYAGSVNTTVGTLDLTTSKIITVQAENGTTSQYTISASIDDNKDEAYLTAMSLKNGDTEYKGTIKDHTITFTVPYMTINASGWKVYATPNASANVVSGTTPVVNGTTTATSLSISTITSLSTTENTNKGTIKAVNKNDNTVYTEYTVVINLEEPKTGNTLKSLSFSAQNTDPTGQANDKVTARVNTANTIKAEIKDSGLVENNVGTITLRAPYSLSTSGNYNIVTEFATNNGGVAYLATYTNSGLKFTDMNQLAALPNNKSTFAGTSVEATDFGADASYNVEGNLCIVVLPEDEARKLNVSYTSDADILVSNLTKSTIYNVVEDPQAASTIQDLKTVSVKNTNLSIGNTGAEVELIQGTLPWSLTASASTDTTKGTFLTYETVNPYATLTIVGATTDRFYSDGDIDGDGYADAFGQTNQKILFVRNADHTVNVYTSTTTTSSGEAYTLLTDNKVTVLAEDGTSKQTYQFKLTWADPNTEAVISSFKIGNSTGSISSDRKISVTVPFGTDLKGLIPTFTASSGAKVEVKNGVELISGKTTVNFTNPVNLIVTSEDGKKTMDYTVTVTVADQFTDVQPDDWFYDNVMRAVELGIAKGKGNGIFDPYGKITRRDFAIMLAQAMGQSNDGEAVSPFPDVADNDYGVVSIKYLYDQKITVGDSEGNFNPNANITRQEVAIMLAKAFGATGTTDTVFTDDAKIASWAKDYVYAAKAAGLMNGDTAGTFRPNDSFTRAEAASAMVNAIDK